jgi:hypothetical protein
MSSTMELDDQLWQFFDEAADRRVEKAAGEALRRIGWNARIFWTRIAHRRGSGAGDATCVEVWCVKLVDIEPEIRHCLSIRDRDPEGEMVDKFVATFEALRP